MSGQPDKRPGHSRADAKPCLTPLGSHHSLSRLVHQQGPDGIETGFVRVITCQIQQLRQCLRDAKIGNLRNCHQISAHLNIASPNFGPKFNMGKLNFKNPNFQIRGVIPNILLKGFIQSL